MKIPENRIIHEIFGNNTVNLENLNANWKRGVEIIAVQSRVGGKSN
jgi:hypothetical protein